MASRNPRPEPGAKDALNVTHSIPDAPDGWRDQAEEAVLILAASGREFDTDDVRKLGVPEPASPNRWGALLAGMHRLGYIVPVGTSLSGRRSRHAGLNRLWVGAEFTRGGGRRG